MLGVQNPETPAFEWHDENSGDVYAYYGDPAEMIAPALWEFYRKFSYDRAGLPYENQSARYIVALNHFEKELAECLRILGPK